MRLPTVDDVLTFAKGRAIEWKSHNAKLYEIIYDYCSDNKDMYVYSITQTLAFLHNTEWKPERVNMDFALVLLTKSPVHTARELTSVIMKEYSPYVSISASIGGLEQVISVDNVRVVSISLFMEDTVPDVYGPWFVVQSKSIRLLQPLMTLFYLSRDAYHPSHLVDIMHHEGDDMLDDMKAIASGALDYIANPKSTQPVMRKDSTLQECVNNIDKFVSNELKDKAITAGYAANGALQVCAKRSIDIAKLIVKEVKSIKGIDRGSYMMSTGFVMGDFRLKRVSVYAHRKDRRINVASVFNNMSYEALPVVRTTVNNKVKQSAHPLVELRLWLYGVSFQRFYGGRSEDIGTSTLWRHVSELLSAAEQTPSAFYIGRYRDDRVDKIKMGMSVWRPKYDAFLQNKK